MNLPDAAANIACMFASNPGLSNLLSTLNLQAIRYGLYAGSYVAIMTNKAGDFNDIDFLVADDDMEKVRQLFPDGLFKDKPYGQFFFPESSQTVECMARATVTVPGHVYDFRLTELANSRVVEQLVSETSVHMLDPADTILLKLMIMQKENNEPGRHDLEDIKTLLAYMDIDRAYLKARIQESGANTPATARLLERLDLAA